MLITVLKSSFTAYNGAMMIKLKMYLELQKESTSKTEYNFISQLWKCVKFHEWALVFLQI